MGRPRKQQPPAQRIMIATESFNGPDGIIGVAGVTTAYDDSDIVRRYPQWFKPLVPNFGTERTGPPPVEAATAAPGEVRG